MRGKIEEKKLYKVRKAKKANKILKDRERQIKLSKLRFFLCICYKFGKKDGKAGRFKLFRWQREEKGM